jgi:hypothetical protein
VRNIAAGTSGLVVRLDEPRPVILDVDVVSELGLENLFVLVGKLPSERQVLCCRDGGGVAADLGDRRGLGVEG